MSLEDNIKMDLGELGFGDSLYIEQLRIVLVVGPLLWRCWTIGFYCHSTDMRNHCYDLD